MSDLPETVVSQIDDALHPPLLANAPYEKETSIGLDMGTTLTIRAHSANGSYAGLSISLYGPHADEYVSAVKTAVDDILSLDVDHYPDPDEAELTMEERPDGYMGRIGLPTKDLFPNGTRRTISFTPGGTTELLIPEPFDETREAREDYVQLWLDSLSAHACLLEVTQTGHRNVFIDDAPMEAVNGQED